VKQIYEGPLRYEEWENYDGAWGRDCYVGPDSLDQVFRKLSEQIIIYGYHSKTRRGPRVRITVEVLDGEDTSVQD
jgi:hypothetical protein